MKIAVIGAGNVGRSLARGFTDAGHQTVIAVRDPESSSACAAADSGFPVLPVGWALDHAEVVVLAVPNSAIAELVATLEGHPGVIVDASNNLIGGPEGRVRGAEPTGAEMIAAGAPGSRVVKAFNTIGWEHLAGARFPAPGAAMLICGTGAEERGIVAGLASDLGFTPVDVGGLSYAASLEHLAALWVRLAISGRDRRFAFAILDQAVE